MQELGPWSIVEIVVNSLFFLYTERSQRSASSVLSRGWLFLQNLKFKQPPKPPTNTCPTYWPFVSQKNLSSLSNYFKVAGHFNHELFNHELFNHELYNHELFNHELSNHELFNHELFNHELFNHELLTMNYSTMNYSTINYSTRGLKRS